MHPPGPLSDEEEGFCTGCPNPYFRTEEDERLSSNCQSPLPDEEGGLGLDSARDFPPLKASIDGA